ncbi:hypothetical protein TorRG33x02_118540 [Trema orientale]|uniref:Uncharacterized protein n=1 Tax=Trema orientale TaxID=63057 RepID=A0A2P5F3N4_TREOI|nr:hypothetical protein TorRG33x02_118540 [Trema orientale]
MLPMISYFLTHTHVLIFARQCFMNGKLMRPVKCFFISTLMEFFVEFRDYSDWTTMRHCSFLMQMIIIDLERGEGKKKRKKSNRQGQVHFVLCCFSEYSRP